MSTRIVPMREALAGPYDGINHLAVAHERRSQFRWFSLVQLFLGGVCLVLCMPVILYLAFQLGLVGKLFDGEGGDPGGDSEDSPKERTWRDSPTSWFRSYWHEIRFRGFRADLGAVPLFEAAAFPARLQDEQALVSAVLEAADTQGLVVMESIGTADPGEQAIVEIWFGGQPLLARPKARNEAQAQEILRGHGFEVEEAGERLDIRWKHPTHHRVLAGGLLLLSPVLFPLFGWLDLTLRDLWGDVLGKPPRQSRLVVRPDGIEVEEVRDGKRSRQERVTGQELLGITVSSSLGHDRAARFQEPSLRLLRRGGRAVTVRTPTVGSDWRHLRDLLIAATLRLRRAHPELGLPVEPQRPGRCPFCATAYVMEPDVTCPSCARAAGSFH